MKNLIVKIEELKIEEIDKKIKEKFDFTFNELILKEDEKN
jgi:hypothetical protein